jgi:hypothetical protein
MFLHKCNKEKAARTEHPERDRGKQDRHNRVRQKKQAEQNLPG